MFLGDLSITVWMFLACEFLVGAIVGASVAKDRVSAFWGMSIAFSLALAVIVYWVVLDNLGTTRPDKFVGTVVVTLVFLFVLWLICLLTACAGYWIAFVASWGLGIGRNRITLTSIFALLTVLAVVAALATAGRHGP